MSLGRRSSDPPVDFIIVGAEKCGTTAAIRNLSLHPDIEVSGGAGGTFEVHFFDMHWNKGIDWYRSKFKYGRPIVGEKTPRYMLLPECRERMRQVVPNAKLIVMLREPAARLRSAWAMYRRTGWRQWYHPSLGPEASFSEFARVVLDTRPSDLFAMHPFNRGLYEPQLRDLCRLFPMNQIHVAIMERVSSNMAVAYEDMLRFIGVNPAKLSAAFYKRHNESPPAEVSAADARALSEVGRAYGPSVRALFGLLGYSIPEWGV